MSDKKPVLQCKQLTKTFSEGGLHVEVLKQCDFSVMPADMIAIVGASGSGKSTLLHCLGGLDKPNSGELLLMQQNFLAMSENKRCKMRNQYLGFVYQFHHLLPEFNTVENIMMPLLIAGENPKLARDKALEWLEKVGLTGRIKHRIGELSGGERQRIAIARALATQPKCVLADEPTGNLDENTAQTIFDLMLELNASEQTSFVMVTHNTNLAACMHKTYSLEQGKLV